MQSLDVSTSHREGNSFSHALKIRARYHYAQNESRGTEQWRRDRDHNWIGNPELSHTVPRYMISLQRRKV